MIPLGTQLGWLVTLAIPVACVAWTVTHEELFREPREYFTRRSTEDKARLQDILNELAPDQLPGDLLEPDAPAAGRYEKILNIKDRGQIFRVDVDDIERIDAAGDYMCIYTADQTLILRETMKDLERRLDPRKFQRIHRSTIVNLDNIRSVKPHTNGECFLVLGSNTQVKVSRSYREVVARFL